MSDYPDQPMCPNCISPWKCNGPHMTTPSETPVTDAASNGPLPNALGTHADETVPAHVARRIENALTESRAECNRLRYEMAAQVQMVVDAEAECERLRAQCQEEIRLRSEAVARAIAAEITISTWEAPT